MKSRQEMVYNELVSTNEAIKQIQFSFFTNSSFAMHMISGLICYEDQRNCLKSIGIKHLKMDII